MNTTEQNILYYIQYTCLVFVEKVIKCWFSSLYIKYPECSPPHLERECRNMYWGVHVFEFKALYVSFSI